MTRKRDRDVPVTVPEHATDAGGKVQVWDMENDRAVWVTPQEAAAGMAAWAAREYGPGTPAHAAAMQQVVAFLAEHGLTPGGDKIGGQS